MGTKCVRILGVLAIMSALWWPSAESLAAVAPITPPTWVASDGSINAVVSTDPNVVCRGYNTACQALGNCTYTGLAPNPAAGLNGQDCLWTMILPYTTMYNKGSGSIYQKTPPVCPAGTTFNIPTGMCDSACTPPLTPDPAGTGCVCASPNGWVGSICVAPPANCPANTTPYVNSSGAGCACNAPNVLDANGNCSACPLDADPLPKPPPPFSDACSQALEVNKGLLPDPAVCQNFDVNKNNKLANCINSKLRAIDPPIGYNGPTATYRTDPYQLHLWQLWSRWKQLDIIEKSVVYLPAVKQACATSAINAAVQAEIKHHGDLSNPTKTAGSHGESRAIDISGRVIFAWMERLAAKTLSAKIIIKGRPFTRPINNMSLEDYINIRTPPCDAVPPDQWIRWGANFKDQPPDIYHFQLIPFSLK